MGVHGRGVNVDSTTGEYGAQASMDWIGWFNLDTLGRLGDDDDAALSPPPHYTNLLSQGCYWLRRRREDCGCWR